MDRNLPHIFLVDDQIYNCKIIQHQIQDFYTVDFFSSGHTILSVLKTNPDLYCAGIIDYMMPGMTGVEVTRKIREFNSEIPLIIVSAYFSDLSEFQLIKEFKDLPQKNLSYLPKPMMKKNLAGYLDNLRKEKGNEPTADK
jgi:CheY-like chemotaxis protein